PAACILGRAARGLNRGGRSMQWTEQTGSSKRPDQVLITGPGEPLAPAWIEFWTRILSAASDLAPGSRAELAIDIYARTFEKDTTGETTARFHNSLHRQTPDAAAFLLRSEHFTLLQGAAEDDSAFARRQLVWFLDHYKALKAALRSAAVWPL